MSVFRHPEQHYGEVYLTNVHTGRELGLEFSITRPGFDYGWTNIRLGNTPYRNLNGQMVPLEDNNFAPLFITTSEIVRRHLDPASFRNAWGAGVVLFIDGYTERQEAEADISAREG